MNQPPTRYQRPGWYRSAAYHRPSFERLSNASHSMDYSAWSISARLIAGIGLYAGLGWLISLWVGHRAPLIAIGALVGLGLAYMLIFRSLKDHEDEHVTVDLEGSGGR
jgi:F0F1-type ATP synthase assembly protein I